MDLSTLFTSLQNTLGATLPAILGALGILIVGWLVAVIARAATRRLLGLLKVNARIQESTGQEVAVESGIAIGVFWVVILVTLVAMLDSMHLDRLSSPFAQLVGKVIGYLPSLVAGTILALAAWLLATFIRAAVNRILAATKLDDVLSREAGMQSMSRTVANVLCANEFWLSNCSDQNIRRAGDFGQPLAARMNYRNSGVAVPPFSHKEKRQRLSDDHAAAKDDDVGP